MKRKKVSIIGAGNVGSAAALWIASKHLADVVLVDIVVPHAKGKALDLQEALPIAGVDASITGTGDYRLTKDSDIVVITAGMPRKEGMSRDDLVKVNADIIKSATKEVAKYSPKCILIIVSNPLDAMVHVAARVSKFPKQRVMGMAGTLDSARFRAFLAEKLDVSVQDVTAFVMGGHGDTMIPVLRYANVAGIPVEDWLPKKELEKIVARTRNGGGEFLPLLKTSAWVAPGIAIAEMAEAILLDKRRVLPVAAYLDGEYGQKGLFIGVPVVLGKNGVEKVIEVKMNAAEKKAFRKTAEQVRNVVKVADRFI
ncbi:malate dehydrogenase [Candidatus Woesearchaeota archaeon]|nr:malate dehydrogenase [Candidatus Woesearchaeota archaeon]